MIDVLYWFLGLFGLFVLACIVGGRVEDDPTRKPVIQNPIERLFKQESKRSHTWSRYPHELSNEAYNEAMLSINKIPAVDIFKVSRLIDRDLGRGVYLYKYKSRVTTNDLTSWRKPIKPEDIHILEVACPTKGDKTYIRVPPMIMKVHEGVAWTFRMTKEEYYKDLVET